MGRPVLLGVVAVEVVAGMVLLARQRPAAALRRRSPGGAATGPGPEPGHRALAGDRAPLRRPDPQACIPLLAAGVPLLMAAYEVGFLALLTPAGLSVREGMLVLAVAEALGAAVARLLDRGPVATSP
jgi:hypothetical protein